MKEGNVSDDALVRLVQSVDPWHDGNSSPLNAEPDEILDRVLSEPRREKFRLRLGARRMTLVAVAVLAVIGGGTAVASRLLSSAGGPDLVPAAGQAPVIHAQQVGGGKWSIATFQNNQGETCFEHSVPRTASDGTVQSAQWDECVNVQQVLAQSPLHAEFNAQRGDEGAGPYTDIAVWGFVDPAIVTRVDVQMSNCDLVPAQADSSGIFEDVFDTAALAAGAVPMNVIAYSTDGAIVAKRSLDLTNPDNSTSGPTPNSCSG